ncbi:MAG: hypothetical protein JHD16_02175 [Solirubrobacteraceae bacterium]|nr:hypothetical protein [Solirubrobacteraceae bacterium]
MVTAYGASGTFGGVGLRSATPTGHPFAAHAVDGWRFLPGQSAYFPAVTPDGTVVMANEPQTDNQLLPTARQMVLSTFDPRRLAFRNEVIATTTGRTEVSGPWAGAAGLVGGGDVSDVELVRQDGGWRIAFTSAMPYWGWDAEAAGVYPTLGYLRRDRGGDWVADPRRSRTALDLARRSHRGAPACQQEATASGRVSAPVGTCHMPAELAQLPRSRALVVTQYASSDAATPSGRISVLDPAGQVLASYAYPRISLPDGKRLVVHPREVNADPTGRRGEERFVVIFDAVGAPGAPTPPFAMQEFRYDDRARTIRPVSVPVLSGDVAANGSPVGFETAQYARDGSLWAAQARTGTLHGAPVAVYRAAGGRAVLGGRPGCSAPQGWHGERWATACAPDARVAAAAPLGVGRSLVEDHATGAMLLTTMSGVVLPMLPPGDATSPRALPPIDLGLDGLVDRRVARIGPRKTAIDQRTGSLWIPVQQLASHASCSTWPCAPAALDQWLFRVDVRAALRP